MKYYIKVGNMYIDYIYTDNQSIKTDFIRRIEFIDKKDNGIKICEEEKSYYVEKICKILKMDKDKCNITFEEVGEDE